MNDREPISLREGARRFAEQMPYLRYLGMGIWWAWIWLCYSSTGLFKYWGDGFFAGYVGSMYLCSTPAIALACIAAAVSWRKSARLVVNRGLIVVFGCIASIGTALVAFSPWTGGDVAFAIGGMATGVGTAALCLKTGAVFGTLGRRDVFTAGCVALMMAAFLYFMGVGLPISWQPVFIATLPLASAFVYIMPSEDPFTIEDYTIANNPGRQARRAFVCLAIAAVMIAATAGFAKGLVAAGALPDSFDYTSSVTTFSIFAGAVLICFLVNIGDEVKMVRLVYAALIVFGVAVVLLSSFGLNLAYLSIGKELLWMLFTCLMSYMVFRFGFSPVRAFGLGQAAYLLASAAAWWFGMLMADTLSGESSRFAVAAAMIAAIVLVFAFVFGDSDLKYILTWKHDGSEEAPFPNAGTDEAEDPRSEVGGSDFEYVAPRELSLHERIELIDPRFGISSREAEVMELFASGRSANWIAEELVISKNTVRSHLRSVYTKLDVHNRQELLDFLNTVPSRD